MSPMRIRDRKAGAVCLIAAAAVLNVGSLQSNAQVSDRPFHKPQPVLDTVNTDAGMIQGLPPNSFDIRMFKGVPYAAPPVADRRWRAPMRIEPWDGVKPATAFSADCVQAPPADGHRTSEDCLYL